MLRDLIEEVLLLQTEWHHTKTPAMDRRGIIVRHEIPDQLRADLPAMATKAGLDPDDTRIEGRDGTGPKTEIPWTRVYSYDRSPSATTGWYAVYLFSAEGDRCYLTLGRGSTVWDGVEFRPRPAAELQALAAWAREQTANLATTRSDLHHGIQLDSRRSNLGPAYEAGTAWAFEYPIDSIPNDAQLLEDLQFMLHMLKAVYTAESSDPKVPHAEPGEVIAASEEISQLSGRRKRSGAGQGFRVNKAEQLAVEHHAVKRAMEYLKSIGWTDLKDVGATHSYDISAREAGEERFVEVKGTTSLGETVLLTPNEVALHEEKHPANALIIVHSIELHRGQDEPTAAGGTLRPLIPWNLQPDRLSPLGFKYEV